ncbi:MAG: glycosyltransferase [Nanoarchaeota archaeon]
MEAITVIVYISIYLGLFATTFYILSFISYSKKEREFYADGELPSVSVIIPAYNEEETIEKTLKSVLKSDYPDFDVIVIDDGSSDNTLKIARKFENEKVRVFHKENGGKGSALNFGLKLVRGKIVFTMDADTTVAKESMKNMVRFFKDDEIMCVSPAIIINKPRNILQRVQYMEYLLGLFLRKAFASLKSIYITPGAFSAYRKSFFDKFGLYDVGNPTEDLEMALRIQYKGYYTENCPEAPVYTTAPSTFKELMIQRRRWYFGLLKNLWTYRKIVGKKYGDLGSFVIPTALVSVILSVMVVVYMFFKTIFEVRDSLIFYQSVNFDFSSIFNINLYFIERVLFLFFSKPVVLFILLFMAVLGFYMRYASKKIGRLSGLFVNLVLFYLFFAILFGLWWVITIFYITFSRTVKWGEL